MPAGWIAEPHQQVPDFGQRQTDDVAVGAVDGRHEGPGQALFRAADAEGRDLGNTGLMDGTVAGSFIHLIDREGE